MIRRPRVFTVNFTSTIRPTLLNEARFGYRANKHVIWAPWEVTDPARRKVPASFLLQGGQGFPVAYAPASVQGSAAQTAMTPNGYFCVTNCAQQGNRTPLSDYADTVSWTKGKHAFKGGAEFRFAYTRGSETPTAPIPKANVSGSGAGLNPVQAFTNATNFPGLVTNNQSMANSLLYFLAGSVGGAQQYYFIQSPNFNNQWMSYIDRNRKINEPHQNEFSLFFKDDWKIRPSLTLNLGVRYDYYGVPYEGQGLTVVPKGGAGLALFGVSGRSLSNWMRPDNPVDLGLVTDLEFVGPKTPNPGKTLFPDDWNNIGPAVGFAWAFPWFGKDKTNIRGGYQITYPGGNHLGNLVNYMFTAPGFVNLAQTSGPTDGSYFDLRNLPSLVPIPPNSLPMQPIPIQKQNFNINAFDPNYVTPYIQNLTLSVTRELSRNLTLDVRYLGTRGLKLNGWFDLNTPDVFYNPALLDALQRTRRGEDLPLFDEAFLGLSLVPGMPAVNGTTQRGSQQMRLSTTFRDALANGDFVTAARLLNTFNNIGSGPTGTVPGAPGERGTVLRRANKGFNVPGGTTIAGGPVVPAGLFSENWISANPQFNQANYWTNSGKSNYHSLQVQTTLRPTQGLTFQGTYIWSRALELPNIGSSLASGLQTAPSWTDPADRDKDYALSANHVTHDFRSYGTFALPVGPNKLLLGNSSGWLARVVEDWQTSFIVNLSTGNPAGVTSTYLNGSTVSPTGLYANSSPDVAGKFPVKDFGKVQWSGDYGSYFGSKFGRVSDPQCAQVAVALKQYCTLQAITDASTGQIVLQNPQPGKRGTLGRQTMELPGLWAFDAAMGKTIRVSETKSLVVRMDATDVLNHPSVGSNCGNAQCAPVLNINGTNPFGFIQAKGDQTRQFKGTLRFNF